MAELTDGKITSRQDVRSLVELPRLSSWSKTMKRQWTATSSGQWARRGMVACGLLHLARRDGSAHQECGQPEIVEQEQQEAVFEVTQTCRRASAGTGIGEVVGN